MTATQSLLLLCKRDRRVEEALSKTAPLQAWLCRQRPLTASLQLSPFPPLLLVQDNGQPWRAAGRVEVQQLYRHPTPPSFRAHGAFQVVISCQPV